MNQTQVVNSLSSVRSSYRWSVDDSGRIVGTPVNHASEATVKTYNPLTALARSQRLGQYRLSKTRTALNKLGVPSELQSSLIDAVSGSENRGQAQVLRGRIRSVLGV